MQLVGFHKGSDAADLLFTAVKRFVRLPGFPLVTLTVCPAVFLLILAVRPELSMATQRWAQALPVFDSKCESACMRHCLLH